MKSGIYQIINLQNNNSYVGSSINILNRIRTHFSNLKNNKHTNKHLQNAYNKYGKESFDYRILANCPNEYCIKLEQWFIDNIKPEYNICKIAGNTLGIKLSQETRDKISKKGKDKKLERRRPINQLDQFTEKVINTYRSVSELPNCFSKSSIQNVLSINQRSLTSNGYKWEYCDSPNLKYKLKKNKKYKEILQYDLNGNFIREWSSLKEINEFTKIDKSNILKSCNKQNKITGGFYWKYKENIEK